jgi:hypothetical protein
MHLQEVLRKVQEETKEALQKMPAKIGRFSWYESRQNLPDILFTLEPPGNYSIKNSDSAHGLYQMYVTKLHVTSGET